MSNGNDFITGEEWFGWMPRWLQEDFKEAALRGRIDWSEWVEIDDKFTDGFCLGALHAMAETFK